MTDTPNEEQAAAEHALRIQKARRALDLAHEAVLTVRERVLDSDGRTEGRQEREKTPLLVDLVDKTDEVYVLLLEWVIYWASELQIDPPSTALVAWRRTAWDGLDTSPGEHAGFPAAATPRGASALTRILTTWLLVHADQIEDQAGAAYLDDLTRRIWGLRSAAGLSRAPIRTTSGRPCPICGEYEVHGEFFGRPIDDAIVRGDDPLDAITGVEVRCAACGWTAERRPPQLARWLSGDRRTENRLMPTPDDEPYLTVKEAAARVKRSTRTIEAWIADGMPTTIVAGVGYVETTVLFATLQEKIKAARNRPRRAVADE